MLHILPLVGALTPVIGPSFASATPMEVRVGYSNAPPYLMPQADGTVKGLTHDIISEAASRLGLKLKWVRFEGGTDKAIIEKHVDIWPMMAITDERKKKFHISDRWLQTHYAILSRQDQPITEPSETRGRLVGHADFPRTTSVAREVLPGARFKFLSAREMVLPAVCRGEVDAGFVETRVVEAALLDRPSPCHGVALRLSVVHRGDFSSGVASTPEAQGTADAIREQIVGLARDGTMARIFSRWNLSSSIDTVIIYDLIEAEDRATRLRWFVGLLVVLVVVLILQYRRLLEARALSEKAIAAKTEFIANMSHELRTPLNGVIGLAEMLAESPIPEPPRDLVRDLADCSHALLGVINDVLDFSKVEAGKLTVESVAFDLHECVRASGATLAFRATHKGLELRVEVDPAVPRWVLGDVSRVRQVLLNLLSNAVKFTSEGSVRLSVRRDGDAVRFTVADTGIGMDAALRSRLFQPFTQADSSTTRKYGGTGLGLAISKRLTEIMSGEIGVEPGERSGSVFWFRIPLTETAPPVERAEAPALRAAGSVSASPRILIAEDNAVNRRVVEHLVRKLGYEADAVINGVEVVAAILRTTYAAVLMDCQMPEMDGYEATQSIRRRESELGLPRLPILALTAHVMESDRDRCLQAGMDDYLTKPVLVQALAAALNKWIGEPAPGTGGLTELSESVGRESIPAASTHKP